MKTWVKRLGLYAFLAGAVVQLFMPFGETVSWAGLLAVLVVGRREET